MENHLKYKSYQFALDLLKKAEHAQDFAMCVAAVTVAESIIADRCQSYLHFKEKEHPVNGAKQRKYVPTKVLVEKCGNYFPELAISISHKDGTRSTCDDLFAECHDWLTDRNEVLHQFAKSEPGTSTIAVDHFQSKAFEAAQNGIRLTRLVNKWHQQQLRSSNKKG